MYRVTEKETRIYTVKEKEARKDRDKEKETRNDREEEKENRNRRGTEMVMVMAMGKINKPCDIIVSNFPKPSIAF